MEPQKKEDYGNWNKGFTSPYLVKANAGQQKILPYPNRRVTMSETVKLDDPNIGALEKEYLYKAIETNFISTVGPFVTEFEAEFANFLGAASCVSTQSGTAALHTALSELGIKPGDEVIVPVITFVASINPVLYVGATPVFVDITPDTWTIDPLQIEKAISPRTKAIIPVHLYGNPCNMVMIADIAQKYNLLVIEDAAESLGATFNGKQTGTFGDVGCFSFNGNKVITTGGGGMLVSNDPQRGKHMKFLVNQARDESKGYFHPEVGFNYRMTNLAAAVGLAQLSRLEDFLSKKQRFYQIYEAVFSKASDIIAMQKTEEGATTSAWLSPVRIDTQKVGLSIPEIQAKLKEKGIPSRRIFYPIVEFPPYLKHKLGSYPNSYDLYENGLNLPGSTLNSEETIYNVANTMLEILIG